ncbi:MAG: HD domain-containing protein [Candidatus Lutacidiplasmatales archaeon]
MGTAKRLILRDPIHGFIPLTETERAIVDTPPIQRLRRIKQLGLTDLVYPSAVHTRFAHSLGAMHVAGLMAEHLPSLSEDDRRVARLCLLLHDVGHGPFSHLFDFICEAATEKKYKHEPMGWEIIRRSKEIMDALGSDAPRVLEELSGGRSFVHDLISGGLDADKLDYLRRDSHHAGVAYGRFDFERILWTLDTDGARHIAVQEKGMDSIEGLRLARQQMHVQVYTHHTRLVADRMLCRIATLFVSDFPGERRWFKYEPTAAGSERILSFDDAGLLQRLEAKAKGPARDLLDRLTSRRLPKRGYEVSVGDMPVDAEADITSGKLPLDDLEEEVAKAVHVPRHLVFAIAPRIDMKQYHGMASGEPILVKLRNGAIKEFGKVEWVQAEANSPVRKLYVFGPEESWKAIEKASINYLRGYV